MEYENTGAWSMEYGPLLGVHTDRLFKIFDALLGQNFSTTSDVDPASQRKPRL